jgi:hypothetical protein
MRGHILTTDATMGGVIAGADGNRYTFAGSDWKGIGEPPRGDEVDFIARDGVAAEIFPLPGGGAGLGAAPAQPATVTGAGSRETQRQDGASVTLGAVGIACLAISFVIPLLPLIVAFIVGLVGADSAKRHDNSTGLVVSRIAWIGSIVLFVAGVLLVIALAFFAWPLVSLIWLSIMNEIAKSGMTSALLAL